MNGIEAKKIMDDFMNLHSSEVNNLYKEYLLAGMGVTEKDDGKLVVYFLTNNKNVDLSSFPEKLGDMRITIEYRPKAIGY